MRLVASVGWIALPILVGGAVHVLVIRHDWLRRLGRMPLDGGASFRGRPLLGANKTVRGALVMVAATTAFVGVEAMLFHRCAWARAASPIDFDRVHPLLWGTLLGGGWIAGELPNSFAKRRLAIAPGAAARGLVAPVFWIADQLDSLAGVLLFMCVAWVPPPAVAGGLALAALVLHPAMALVMMGLGLKQRVG